MQTDQSAQDAALAGRAKLAEALRSAQQAVPPDEPPPKYKLHPLESDDGPVEEEGGGGGGGEEEEESGPESEWEDNANSMTHTRDHHGVAHNVYPCTHAAGEVHVPRAGTAQTLANVYNNTPGVLVRGVLLLSFKRDSDVMQDEEARRGGTPMPPHDTPLMKEALQALRREGVGTEVALSKVQSHGSTGQQDGTSFGEPYRGMFGDGSPAPADNYTMHAVTPYEGETIARKFERALPHEAIATEAANIDGRMSTGGAETLAAWIGGRINDMRDDVAESALEFLKAMGIAPWSTHKKLGRRDTFLWPTPNEEKAYTAFNVRLVAPELLNPGDAFTLSVANPLRLAGADVVVRVGVMQADCGSSGGSMNFMCRPQAYANQGFVITLDPRGPDLPPPPYSTVPAPNWAAQGSRPDGTKKDDEKKGEEKHEEKKHEEKKHEEKKHEEEKAAHPKKATKHKKRRPDHRRVAPNDACEQCLMEKIAHMMMFGTGRRDGRKRVELHVGGEGSPRVGRVMHAYVLSH